jgi:hypothetical protein
MVHHHGGSSHHHGGIWPLGRVAIEPAAATLFANFAPIVPISSASLQAAVLPVVATIEVPPLAVGPVVAVPPARLESTTSSIIATAELAAEPAVVLAPTATCTLGLINPAAIVRAIAGIGVGAGSVPLLRFLRRLRPSGGET